MKVFNEIINGDSENAVSADNSELSFNKTGSGRQTSISDELAVKTFQFLLDTQYIGKSSPEKRKAVDKIKNILNEWLER